MFCRLAGTIGNNDQIDKRIAVAKCVQCHDKEAVYQKSIHGKGVASGNMDSAACHDCHNLHAVEKLAGALAPHNVPT